MSNQFPVILTPQRKINNKIQRNDDQQRDIQQFELKSIEKDVFKELDQIYRKHCVQISPSSTPQNNQQSQTQSFFKFQNRYQNNSPKQIRHSQEYENKVIRTTANDNQNQQTQTYNEDIFEKHNTNRNITGTKSIYSNKRWVSPVIQKQDLIEKKRNSLMQRQKKQSFSCNVQNMSFYISAKCQAIHSFNDKKQQMESVKKQNQSFQNEKLQTEASQLNKMNKSMNNHSIQINNLCELPFFNNSLRIQRLNTASSSSSRNIDKTRSLSNTIPSMLYEHSIKKDIIQSVNDGKIKNSSFDFYFYDDPESKAKKINGKRFKQKSQIDTKH